MEHGSEDTEIASEMSALLVVEKFWEKTHFVSCLNDWEGICRGV